MTHFITTCYKGVVGDSSKPGAKGREGVKGVKGNHGSIGDIGIQGDKVRSLLNNM